MLKEKIQGELVSAMKEKNEVRVSTLRMLIAAMRNKEIEKRPLRQDSGQAALTDDDLLAVVQSEIKKRSDAIADYTRGGRPELAEKEASEKTILETYLPEQLSDDALDALVGEAIAESNATSAKDFGAVMGALMPKVKGKAEGKRVSEAVKKKLG